MSSDAKKFIIEARKRGFSDLQIRKAFNDKNYPENIVEKAFLELQPKFKSKNQMSVFLSNEILESLEKRAKKNMMTINEQVEDILRRSTISGKNKIQEEKIDDLLLTCFSRARRGRK